MAIDVMQESIRLYAKQLKIPTFSEYPDVLRQCPPDVGFAQLLLELMKRESSSRQENQNKRPLKNEEFPYHKTIDEFDVTQLNGNVFSNFYSRAC